ncbi:glycosyltransferase family 92 protein RCOM_0530710 [Selaginella moellendorffii]|uniref:glycosyltransferase family 92 protein RCOM_0530710 n=1 Tax=Selaginella moellendorffii TaxID=88036 RepID=UPI000D1CE02E|nr:glycosyltransferase family 92 protein RCOM_0530710 [Selaginella moellendorffii]|eukprot:XP_024535947.1 glycosyltransferase family 92 protein RCOM_0530710 [Selaginella moellendorffii]
MARSISKNAQGGAQAAAAVVALGISRFKRLDALCGVFVVFSLVAAGFLMSSSSPGDVFLPVLGSNLLTGSKLRVEEAEIWEPESVDHVYIQDVVALPEEVLLLIKTPASSDFLRQRQSLGCVVGDGTLVSVQGMDMDNRRLAVRCNFSSSSQVKIGASGGVVSLTDVDSGRALVSSPQVEAFQWDFLVFEAVVTPLDVLVFAKGIVTKRGQQRRVKDLNCVFGDGAAITKVTSAAQEVFRCAHPPLSSWRAIAGKKVTLSVDKALMPSVAYYEQGLGVWKAEMEVTRKYFLCSCTMVFNVAKFLKEWVIFHSKLGVERFFFYDNNSEDNVTAVLEDLKQYNVSRHFWPWVKSQEAGFSHCALRAEAECTWMVYADVDEFIYPTAWIKKNSRPLTALVQSMSSSERAQKKVFGLWRPWQSNKMITVGQIFLGCRVFGPSGQQTHPVTGVTQGYTCRTRKLQRHKSIVLLGALDPSLLNVVHHFQLRPGYANASVPSSKGVINHYKYQAWDEFRGKFRRRVSAYVSDWKQKKNLDSNDRTPGLGTQEVEPVNWKHKFCEVNDTSLRDYVLREFSQRGRRGVRQMAWQ